jgi:hypothetical protein
MNLHSHENLKPQTERKVVPEPKHYAMKLDAERTQASSFRHSTEASCNVHSPAILFLKTEPRYASDRRLEGP